MRMRNHSDNLPSFNKQVDKPSQAYLHCSSSVQRLIIHNLYHKSSCHYLIYRSINDDEYDDTDNDFDMNWLVQSSEWEYITECNLVLQ